MGCELLVSIQKMTNRNQTEESSVWFLFVIFWMETISTWLFLCHRAQDRAFYHGAPERAFGTNPAHPLGIFAR